MCIIIIINEVLFVTLLGISAKSLFSFTEGMHPFPVGAHIKLLMGPKAGDNESVWRTSKVWSRLLCRRQSLHFPYLSQLRNT
jgi:hypothetical protein